MNKETKITIARISKNERSILLSNGRHFVTTSQFDLTIKLWNEGDIIDIKKHNSDNPYSYELKNLRTEDSIFCGYGN